MSTTAMSAATDYFRYFTTHLQMRSRVQRGGSAQPTSRRSSPSAIFTPDHCGNYFEDGMSAYSEIVTRASLPIDQFALDTPSWCVLTSNTPGEAIVTRINRGGDTDIISAITGAVAGAWFGADSLPVRWLDALDHHQELDDLAEQLSNV